jgi:carbamoyl-phosphate synthase small subunit
LEDGRVFSGYRFGAASEASGEVVFNTSLTGYQEIITDPSYAGQMVVMTYPMIGNYGLADDDNEARKPFLAALIVKEPSRIVSNWRSTVSLDAYLTKHAIPGLWGIDTRALVHHLRKHGALRAVIADAKHDTNALVARSKEIRQMVGCDLAKVVTLGERFSWKEASVLAATAKRGPGHHVVAYDFGIKWSILRNLVDVGCQVTVVPAQTSADDVLALKPDGVIMSNGPGDPEPVEYAVKNIKALLGRVPLFGICLGHQLLGLACGGKTYKLKFGHHGGNHPVMDLSTKKVEITAHNHNFAVDPESLPHDKVEVTHINLNDKTCEGLRRKDVPAFSVQYHPEGAPGPHDAHYLFGRFTAMMNEFKPRAS